MRTRTAGIMMVGMIAACLSGCGGVESGYNASVRRNTAMQKQLGELVDLTALEEETTFEEAIVILRNSANPPLKAVVFWNDISNNAFIEKDCSIGISGEGLSEVSLRTGLKLVIEAVGGGGELGQLDYVIYDGIVLVTTRDMASSYFEDDDSWEGDYLDGTGDFGEAATQFGDKTVIQGEEK